MALVNMILRNGNNSDAARPINVSEDVLVEYEALELARVYENRVAQLNGPLAFRERRSLAEIGTGKCYEVAWLCENGVGNGAAERIITNAWSKFLSAQNEVSSRNVVGTLAQRPEFIKDNRARDAFTGRLHR